jgi:hypothetical protein
MSSLQALTIVLLRFFAAFAVATSAFIVSAFVVPLFSYLFRGTPPSDIDAARIPIALLALAAVVAGVCVWIFAGGLVGLFVRAEEEGSIGGEMSPFDLVGAGTFLIGIYFLLGSLPGALVRTFFLVHDAFSPDSRDRVMMFVLSSQTLASEWAQALLSLVAIMRPYMLVRMFDRLRTSAFKARARAG